MSFNASPLVLGVARYVSITSVPMSFISITLRQFLSRWTTAHLEPGQTWPTGGEIDIMEGINLNPNPQMGLHTTAGCMQKDPQQTSTSINGTDCTGAGGCITTYNDPASYGEAFAAAGGGAFVTEFSNEGIS